MAPKTPNQPWMKNHLPNLARRSYSAIFFSLEAGGAHPGEFAGSGGFPGADVGDGDDQGGGGGGGALAEAELGGFVRMAGVASQ